MIYQGSEDWLNASHKRVLLFGMSGLGKTHVSNMLRTSGDWFHYSVDYRIGTRYMGELIADSFKRKAMHVPYLRQLLMSDSIYIASNITFDNLSPLHRVAMAFEQTGERFDRFKLFFCTFYQSRTFDDS